jgi:hypothetical protein
MEYSALARSYSSLHTAKQLREALSTFFCTDVFHGFSKLQLATKYNKTLFENYNGEEILKYWLAKEFQKKKYVGAFEVKAKSSRADFLVINGNTKSFEIKSRLDNLSRLPKQISDYGDVFEYNTLVIDAIHLECAIKLVPAYYGIWFFEKGKKIVYRDATYSPNLCSHSQLTLFNKKELMQIFSNFNVSEIIETFTQPEINLALNINLKRRYEKRWEFLTTRWNEILPIDVQFFFQTNIEPEIIYG